MPGALIGFAVAAFLVGGIAARFHHDVVRLYEARERLARGARLVDVDAAGDFARRHPELAVNIPLHDLAARAHELGAVDTPIVVFAHRWRDGARAVHVLRSVGYLDVFDAAGVRAKEVLAKAALPKEDRGVPEDIELAPRGT